MLCFRQCQRQADLLRQFIQIRRRFVALFKADLLCDFPVLVGPLFALGVKMLNQFFDSRLRLDCPCDPLAATNETIRSVKL